MYNILLTCPPMIKQISRYGDLLDKYNFKITIPDFQQVMTEEDLCKIIGQFDGWIIGDDPATKKVFQVGIEGNLKACVKWGVGTDNVDFDACKELNIPICNTPQMFGEEVSDIAIGYLLCLSRQLHTIHNSVVNNEWLKPCGMSLNGKKACLVGFGDIGKNIARKLLAFNLSTWVYDPFMDKKHESLLDGGFQSLHIDTFENCIENSDFIFIACALTDTSKYLIRKDTVKLANKGVKIINVARGPIVKEDDIVELLKEQFVTAVGFDVFEVEPLSIESKLRDFPQNIFGTHNGSNTLEAVDKVSIKVLTNLYKFFNI